MLLLSNKKLYNPCNNYVPTFLIGVYYFFERNKHHIKINMSLSSRLRKILIANRGEIACRIIRTAKRLGIKTVSVYSDVDVNAMHVQMADEAYHIGPPSAQESYLRGDKIIAVAKKSGAVAVHPGYGFLSENAEFAACCEESGIIFIGPPPSAIREMGIKSTSKMLIEKAGVPTVPGYHGSDQSDERLATEAENMGFPVIIKAVRGGGGKGMRIVRTGSDFQSALESARTESMRSFGDSDVLIERYIERPRHVEVQVFGDRHGNYVHLFERDCSIQRRHQKILEQSPAPILNNEKRLELGVAGAKVAEAVGYVGAGTVEFILDTLTSTFYFMEMNTRLQVEHPVTEMVTGLDLVEWQLLVAGGEPLPLKQSEISLKGAALEARIYAEDNNFMPTAGILKAMSSPQGEFVRVDSGVTSGSEVTVHYDPMIAKLIVWDPNINEIYSKMDNALKNFNIVGVENNVDYLRKLCRNQNFIEGNVHTNFIEENKDALLHPPPSENIILQAAMAFVLHEKQTMAEELFHNVDRTNPFFTLQSYRLNHNHRKNMKFVCLEKEYNVQLSWGAGDWYYVQVNNNKEVKVSGNISDDGLFANLKLLMPECVFSNKIAINEDTVYIFGDSAEYQVKLIRDEHLWDDTNDEKEMKGNGALSPMPGIVEKILVKSGESVKKGQPLAVVIAMKMEHVIKSDREGSVSKILFKPGDNIEKNVAIITLEA